MRAIAVLSLAVLVVGCVRQIPAPPPTSAPAPAPAEDLFPVRKKVDPSGLTETDLAARFRNEVRGLHAIRAQGNITDDEYYKGVDRAIDAMAHGMPESNSVWLGQQLDILAGMKGDGLLTPPEFEHARSLLVERYEK